MVSVSSRWVAVFAAGFLSVGAASTHAQAQGAEGVAGQSADYTYDKDVYARLRVTLRYGDVTKPIDLAADCPKKGLWSSAGDFGGRLSGLMKSDHTFSLGFSITTPNDKTVQLTPVQIEIKDRLFGASKCNIHIEQIDYISPIFAIGAAGSKTFRVEPAVYVREKPSGDFVQASRQAAAQMLKLIDIPAPLADQVGGVVGNALEGSGPNLTSAYAVPITMTPRPGHPEDFTSKEWRAEGMLTGAAKPFVIRAELENVASIIAVDRHHLSPDIITSNRYAGVLSAPFLGEYQGGLIRDVSNLTQYATRSTGDLVAFNTKQTAAEANDACRNIFQLLDPAGLTQTDRSLIVWALARSQPLIGMETAPGKNLDQISCIQDQQPYLNAVGVTLRPSIVVEQAYNPPTKAMQSAIEVDSAFARFFQWTDSLDWAAYAQQLFTVAPRVSDTHTQVFKESRFDLRSNTEWRYHTTQAAAPLLKRVGCYAYAPSPILAPDTPRDGQPSSTVWAIGLTAAGQEVAIKASFAPVVGQKAPVIDRLDISDTLDSDTRKLIQDIRKGAACGEDRDWRPALLFGV